MDIIELPPKSFYLASYPRSGNTWLMYSLSMLFSAIRAEARSSFELYPYVYGREDQDSFYFRTEYTIDKFRPLIIKTHESYDTYKKLYPPRKCLYIYRDGRDVLLSFYFYHKMFADKHSIVYEQIGTKQEVTTRTVKPVNFNSEEFSDFLRNHTYEWANHVSLWHEGEDVFPLSYENLYHNYDKVLSEIIAYLGIEPIKGIAEVAEEYVNKFRQHFNSSNQSFFRKGIIGDWKNYFTEEHRRLFLEAGGEVLIKLGYDI